MRVCIDTHILIWGVQKVANSSQANKIQQSERFIQWLEENGHDIAVPAPALAEFLTGLTDDKANVIQGICIKRFKIMPFDTAAASKYAEIYQGKKSVIPNNRNLLKADCMIIAVAVTINADCIYSDDEDLKKVAEGFIEVRPVPEIPFQPKIV